MDVVDTLVDNQLRDAEGTHGVHKLLCGYLDDEQVLHDEVLLRAFTGIEEDLLASRRVRAADKMNLFLAGCIERIGEITDKGRIRGIVPRLLLGDRTFLFFALRRITHGDIFPFRQKCPDRTCGSNEIYRVDLSTLDVYPMPQQKKRMYEVTLPRSKSIVVWRPMCGADEAKRDELKKRIGLLTLNLLLRVEALDGEPADANRLARLCSGDRDFLRAQIDEFEGGVETAVDLTCPVCGYEFEKEVDPSEPSFFFPSDTQQRWKRRRSSSSTNSEYPTMT